MANKPAFKKKAIPTGSRRALAERYGCRPGSGVCVACVRCGSVGSIIWTFTERSKVGWVGFYRLEIDHVIPECEGGSSEPENLQLLCRGCNRRKEILRRFPRVTT